MFRYRKIWIFVAGVVMILVLIGSFFRPELVTVVPDQKQLNKEKPDLRLHNEHDNSKDQKPSQKSHETDSTDLPGN